ncbi:hypothetical protein TCAL_04914 [Tigriopus californicus]|uniref:Arf-GAP domain-containing protein n=1 Tax=Tigriopus californicus TaxID=6832 RepID=A0A553NE86_TIGCA|nr:ARF GTPase-activating protein GIT2-like [Tigriopus californicus]TRY63725.1 hypothetical protein TCAL_04914 [Tigriopus californicus]|eukprot:TCALIF_04914-PA protein Name:"Similar to GIT2 ARF GTPase-activating protein GIT2 (Homo sapiens)" AED:0.01 eAED:0.01 QI:365/1/1/1/1/1/2/303/852
MFKSSPSVNLKRTGSHPHAAHSSSHSSGASGLAVCADCAASAPLWASINRGVLLCGDCASIHRSLGRHVSHVKCLSRGGNWIPEQLSMVQSLYSCGANSIWEYSLLNPGSSSSKGSRKKPSPSDPLHPIKSDFITAKYLNLTYVYRPAKDEPVVSESDLSRQLHSSVRTANLETSLRLLSQGADPNYYHPEKNSTPLQVAARAGQTCQVELLLVYGADPGAVDKGGRTAYEYAQQAGHGVLAHRIHGAQYELSDRLSFFLCQKKPDHVSGQHFIVPDVEVERSPDRVLAKRKMQMLNNAVFEELAMDVYDEVDRRETDIVWATMEASLSAKNAAVIPFLPVNPDYGTTRNQGRQKLARLSAKEFSILVLDILKEIRRRQNEMDSKWPPGQKMPSPLRETPVGTLRGSAKVGQTKSLPVQRVLSSTVSDDEPIYDHVASDDDYYHIPDTPDERSSESGGGTLPRRPHSSSGGGGRPRSSARQLSSNSSPAKSNHSSMGGQDTLNSGMKSLTLQPNEYRELRAQLNDSEVKVQMLIESNDDMRGEISRLSLTVNKLISENEQLRLSFSPSHSNSVSGGIGGGGGSHLSGSNHYNNSSSTANLIRGLEAANSSATIPYVDGVSNRSSPAPTNPRGSSVSMYEPRNNILGGSGPTSMPSPGANYLTLQGTRYPSSSQAPSINNHRPPFYDSYEYDQLHMQQQSNSLPYSLASSQHHEYADPRELTHSVSGSSGSDSSTLPSQEEVVRRTEAITRCIQELLVSAKDDKFDGFIPCSERIVRAVTDMVLLFPEEPGDSAISASLSSLTAASTHFETECRILIARSHSEPLHQSFVFQQVIQCAFDIAKSTKQLVALFQ